MKISKRWCRFHIAKWSSTKPSSERGTCLCFKQLISDSPPAHWYWQEVWPDGAPVLIDKFAKRLVETIILLGTASKLETQLSKCNRAGMVHGGVETATNNLVRTHHSNSWARDRSYPWTQRTRSAWLPACRRTWKLALHSLKSSALERTYPRKPKARGPRNSHPVCRPENPLWIRILDTSHR